MHRKQEDVYKRQGQTQREIITIVDKGEYRLLMDFLGKTDPNSFVTVYPVHEVFYRSKV